MPPGRPPPPIPVLESSSIETSLSKSHFLHSSHQQELSVDDIDDIDDIDDLEDEDEEIILRHHSNETSDLLLGLPSFATGKISRVSFFLFPYTNGTTSLRNVYTLYVVIVDEIYLQITLFL